MDDRDITIAIVAYNAESTIKRAILSALSCGNHPILLVDDQSTDHTVKLAKSIAGNKINIVSTAGDHGVGKARQTALEHITTPYGLWLDADDEILPGRAEAFAHSLKKGADLIYGEGILANKSGADTALSIPAFISESPYMVRNFERNWLPLLHCGFNLSFARSVNFDMHFSCAEDYDFLLRAILAGGRIQACKDAAYRHHHSPNSISRNLPKTRQHVKRALEKHPDNTLKSLLSQSPLKKAEQHHILASNLIYQGRPADSLQHCSAVTDQPDMLLPQYGLGTKWVASFLQATALWQQGLWEESRSKLDALPHKNTTAEVLNNLGACCKKMSDLEYAEQFFSKALALKPLYSDASQNLRALNGDTIFYTTHPFRQHASRDTYA